MEILPAALKVYIKIVIEFIQRGIVLHVCSEHDLTCINVRFLRVLHIGLDVDGLKNS